MGQVSDFASFWVPPYTLFKCKMLSNAVEKKKKNAISNDFQSLMNFVVFWKIWLVGNSSKPQIALGVDLKNSSVFLFLNIY